MKGLKIILELVFYVAIVVAIVISVNLLLKDKSNVMLWSLVISLAIMVIHQLKDDLTLWFAPRTNVKKYNNRY